MKHNQFRYKASELSQLAAKAVWNSSSGWCLGKKGQGLEKEGKRAERKDWVWRDRNKYGSVLSAGCSYRLGKPTEQGNLSARTHKRNCYYYSYFRVIIKHIPAGWSESTSPAHPLFFQKPIKSFPKKDATWNRSFSETGNGCHPSNNHNESHSGSCWAHIFKEMLVLNPFIIIN